MDYKERTIYSYNKNARNFSEKFKDFMYLKLRPEFEEFLSLLSGKKILDLGCGSGDHAVYFVEKGLDVTCVDLSEEMIKLCKEKSLNAYVEDLENLPFEKESFDGIWAVTSLLHIPKVNLSKVCKNLHSLLKKDGILFVTVKEGEGEEYIDDRFFAYWKEDEFLKEFTNFTFIKSYKDTFKKRLFIKAFFRK